MENIVKKVLIFVGLALVLITSIVVLDIVSVDVSKNTMFYTVFGILILIISSMIILNILDDKKKK